MSDYLTTQLFLDHIRARIRDLHEERDKILRLEGFLSQGRSLCMEEQEVVSTKPAILNSIEELEKLMMHFNPILADTLSPDTDSVRPDAVMNTCTVMKTCSRYICHCPYQETPKRNEITTDQWDKERYLCVSDGFSICCLDLKDYEQVPSDYCSSLQKVPKKTSTLELLEEDFPFSLGLLRFDSDAYMVGGQHFPGFKAADRSDLEVLDSDLEVFRFLHKKYPSSGDSSGKLYSLTLDNGGLRLSQRDTMGSMNKPKLWPLVEMIGNHLHVMECYPYLERGDIASHEFLNLTDTIRRWRELSSPRIPVRQPRMYLWRYLVVGHRIFVAYRYMYQKFLVYDTKRKEWESHAYPLDSMDLPYVKHVINILTLGIGRCVGEFLPGHSSNRAPLYLVLGIGSDEDVSGMISMVAVAYLVTEEGQVLCFQILNRFFEDLKEPFSILEGTVISSGEQGKTICVILRGYETSDSLFITTCTWEEADGALDLVSRILEKDGGDAIEKDFVNVVGKGSYVSQLGMGKQPGNIPTRLSACFLPFA